MLRRFLSKVFGDLPYDIQRYSKTRLWKYYSQASPSQRDQMVEILKMKFPNAKTIDVADISGGCGAMYEVHVESVDFKGLSIVKQHRLINDYLKDQIKDMHGIRIQTGVPTGNT